PRLRLDVDECGCGWEGFRHFPPNPQRPVGRGGRWFPRVSSVWEYTPDPDIRQTRTPGRRSGGVGGSVHTGSTRVWEVLCGDGSMGREVCSGRGGPKDRRPTTLHPW